MQAAIKEYELSEWFSNINLLILYYRYIITFPMFDDFFINMTSFITLFFITVF